MTLDLFGLLCEQADRAVEQIAKCIEIPPEAIMLVSSHTRGAPCTVGLVGHREMHLDYADEMADKLPGLVAEAKDNLQDASLGVGSASLPHLVYNHRLITRNMKTVTAWLGVPKNEVIEPEGPTDPEFSVLVIRDAAGEPLCVVWNFAADNRFSQDDQVSAGLPGLVQEELDARAGRHLPSLYLTGCEANVSYSRPLDETVDALASAIMAVQLETSCDPLIKLGCARERMILPVQDFAEFWDRADIELKYPQAVDAFGREIELLQQEDARAVETSVQAFRLGALALAGLPGMPFVELALDIKHRSPFVATLVAGNVNDYPGYVCTQKAFEYQGFETWTARSAKIGRGGGEFMAERCAAWLAGLWNA